MSLLILDPNKLISKTSLDKSNLLQANTSIRPGTQLQYNITIYFINIYESNIPNNITNDSNTYINTIKTWSWLWPGGSKEKLKEKGKDGKKDKEEKKERIKLIKLIKLKIRQIR